MCWGSSTDGVLGNGVEPTIPNAEAALTPVAVSGLTDAVELAAGPYHICARRADGTAVCWGDNAFGALGSVTVTSTSNVPAAVTGLTDVAQLTVGFRFSCARKTDGTVACWGSNDAGQLGSAGPETTTPRTVTGVSNVIDVSAGDNYVCVTRADHTAVCWGRNDFRQIADTDTGSYPEPFTIPGF